MSRRLGLLLAVALLWAPPAAAQWTRSVDFGASYGEYDGDLGVARGQFLNLLVSRPQVWDWRIGGGHAERFGAEGWGVGTSLTRHLPSGLNFTLGFGTGSGDVVLPEYRLDASVGFGVLPRRQLLLILGYTRIQSSGENKSDGVSLSANWYLGRWILGGNYLHDTGYPGRTVSRSGGVGLTYSMWRSWDLGAGLSFGDVSYILLSPGEARVDYATNGYYLGGSLWLGDDWGLNLRLDAERTSFYEFRGGTLSVFKEF